MAKPNPYLTVMPAKAGTQAKWQPVATPGFPLSRE